MKSSQSINLEQFEGRSFILGREGHIYIDSPTASKHHAEIRITGGKIHLRDLNSTNGTFLLNVRGDETFVRRDSIELRTEGTIGLGRAEEPGSSLAIHYKAVE